MRTYYCAIAFLFLTSCAPEDELASLTQKPSDSAPALPIPTSILSQSDFLQTFRNLCLTSPNYLSEFRKVATRFGLTEERSPERFKPVYSNYYWRSPEEHEDHALEITVGSGDIVYEIVGDGSGLPSRQRSCSMTAYLDAYDDESQREFERVITEDFLPFARTLDFSAYANDYEVSPQDISVDFKLPSRSSYVDLRSTSECPRGNPCWRLTPHTVSLNVVIDRIP